MPATEPPPLTGKGRAIGTMVLSLATFMNVLDHSIANVALPAIAGDLGASVHQGTRVIRPRTDTRPSNEEPRREGRGS